MKNQINNRLGFTLCCIALLAIGFTFMSFQSPSTKASLALSENSCPEASFSVDAGPFYVQTEIAFTNQSAYALAYYWDFGDGNTSAEINPRHSYQNTGTYEVTLIAVYSECEDSFIGIVDIVGS